VSSVLIPCPGCGALFPPYDGPTHRYVGASAGCWALTASLTSGGLPDPELLRQSRASHVPPALRPQKDAQLLDPVWGDAYGVQHHGDDSPQAIQSVAIHLLTLHGAITRRADGMWVRRRALRIRVFFTNWNLPHWVVP
jgi:hypothetical protein